MALRDGFRATPASAPRRLARAITGTTIAAGLFSFRLAILGTVLAAQRLAARGKSTPATGR